MDANGNHPCCYRLQCFRTASAMRYRLQCFRTASAMCACTFVRSTMSPGLSESAPPHKSFYPLILVNVWQRLWQMLWQRLWEVVAKFWEWQHPQIPLPRPMGTSETRVPLPSGTPTWLPVDPGSNEHFEANLDLYQVPSICTENLCLYGVPLAPC